MSFTNGVHVEFGYGGATKRSDFAAAPNFPVDGETVRSETMMDAGTSSIAAPEYSSTRGDPLVYIDAAIDVFVATGPSPDAAFGARKLVRAGVPRQWYVTQGDRVAWVEADT